MTSEIARHILAAIWANDSDTLNELARCGCCCDEHWFESCDARWWGGCRGGVPHTMDELKKLALDAS